MIDVGMIELDDDELRTWFGFGVAGNFAGHLDQAGEAVHGGPHLMALLQAGTGDVRPTC